jgi:hypothetical protein
MGGLWPAELATITPENASAADYLKVDLQRIVDSANEELKAIRWTLMPDFVRQAEQTRVVNAARTFAIRRVESTLRHLQTAARLGPVEHRPADGAAASIVAADPAGMSRPDAPGRHAAAPTAPPEAAEAGSNAGPDAKFERADTAVLVSADPAAGEISQKPANAAFSDLEADTERLWRLLKFVARQEPGLRWAVGKREDGDTVVVTDMAHGWVPPGISLPAGVRLLEPERRSGNAAALLGPSALSVSYAPGDPLGWATNPSATDASPLPRALPMIDDLGWGLTEATHWRDGLPRMVHTLAKAGAAGTGVMEAEVDVLRVHLDTARYQLLAQYPDVDSALLLNCLLLAATEGIATGDELSANYHFAWFQRLDTPLASNWAGQA